MLGFPYLDRLNRKSNQMEQEKTEETEDGLCSLRLLLFSYIKFFEFQISSY